MRSMIRWFMVFSVFAVFNGCVNSRYVPGKPLKSGNGVIVGTISEGYLTQPHDLWVYIRPVGAGEHSPAASIHTLGYGDEDSNPNILSNSFMYELPPGKYEIYNWRYRFYRGSGIPRQKPIIFTVKPNEVSYIGHLHGVALTMCLSNYNDYSKDIKRIKEKYPVLQKRKIVNKAPSVAFRGWPNEKSEDLFGRGKCK